MLEQNNSNLKFYYPICNQKDCDGLLKIKKFDEYNFSIDYVCEKNKNHKGKGIYFDTFEKFYLKERLFMNCSKCNVNLDNNSIYKCRQCGNIFCLNCYKNDSHILENNNNLIIYSTQCKIHQKELIKYCTSCGKKICIYCLKNNYNNDFHKNHRIEDILDNMPSNNDINISNEIIRQKSEFIENLINNIDKWQKNLIKKITRVKKNLESEIRLIKKMFLNFNVNFENYIYYKNFKNYYNNYNVINNEYLFKFNNSIKFEEQTKYLIKIISFGEKEFEPKNGILQKKYEIEDGIISKINDYMYMVKSLNLIEIDYYIKQEDKMYHRVGTQINFEDKIYSISYSNKINKIFICLLNRKSIKIFNVNINEYLIQKDYYLEIKDKSDLDGHFNKCIYLNNKTIAAADDNKIVIYEINNNSYSKIRFYQINTEINDIILANKDYFVFSKSAMKSIVFFNMIELSQKEIKNIDCINSPNCLFLIEDYIIINCINGIAILLIKTKELVQYIQNFNGYKNKKINIDDNNNIYILNNSEKLSFKKMKLSNGCLITTEEYKNIEFEKDKYKKIDISSNLYNFEIFYSNGAIIIWKKNIYILKERNEE